MRKFICISGKAQNGKDTVANLLKSELESQKYSVLIIHQADLLKFICKNYFGWNGEKDDYGRTLLQKVGTDVIRQKSPDFWVDFIERVTAFFDGSWDYILVPDTRFPNEIERLRTQTSEVIHVRITRPDFLSPLSPEQQKHPSETALDNTVADYNIINDDGLDSLQKKIKNLINKILEAETNEKAR